MLNDALYFFIPNKARLEVLRYIFSRLALEKDSDYVMASVTLGQALLQEGLLEDAADCLEKAVLKVGFFLMFSLLYSS